VRVHQVRDVKPGPERSEGPASSIGPMCKREPERSEGSGAKFPQLFSFFWYTLERNLVLKGPNPQSV